MLDKKFYANGQKIHEINGETLTYYYKNGKIRAEGLFTGGQMEGEWTFYRETGQLWQTGNFKNNKKHGAWIRYDRNGSVEYHENFDNGMIIKKK